ARGERPQSHETLTLAAFADTLTPYLNRPVQVPSALSDDLTSLVPLDRLLPPASCAAPEPILPALRGAGVSHVLSLDRVAAPGPSPGEGIPVPRLAPLRVFVAAGSEPLPLRYVASGVRAGVPPAGAVVSTARTWVEGAPEGVESATGTVRSLREDPDHLELE